MKFLYADENQISRDYTRDALFDKYLLHDLFQPIFLFEEIERNRIFST